MSHDLSCKKFVSIKLLFLFSSVNAFLRWHVEKTQHNVSILRGLKTQNTQSIWQDGETNLKIKKPVDVRQPWQPIDAPGAGGLHLTAHVEAPSADLHVVRGALHVHGAGAEHGAIDQKKLMYRVPALIVACPHRWLAGSECSDHHQ